jgi:DNA replication protein DnaC
MIIWLKDALNCDQIRQRVLEGDQSFQTKMINYIDDCISNSIPTLSQSSELESVPSDNVHPCAVRGITDLQSRRAREKDVRNLIRSCQTHKHSATCYKYWKRGQPRECRFSLGEHHYCEKTEFDLTSGELHMRHLDGLVNNFNTTMLEIIRCNMDIQFLGSGPSTKAIIYYITDYITKAQLKSHVAYAALELAVQKLEQSITPDDSAATRAKRLLQKCAYSMISQQELSGQQVASYLLDLEDHFSSHVYAPIYWTTYEKMVDRVYPLQQAEQPVSDENNTEDKNDEPVENDIEDIEEKSTELDVEGEECYNDIEDDEGIISTNHDGNLKLYTSHVQNYLLRGPELRSLSVWEYTSLIEKISKKRTSYHAADESQSESIQTVQTTDDTGHLRPKYSFECQHPDSETHIQQIRHPKRRPIPMPIGPRLPRRDRPESREKYCRTMLLLFKPWTVPEDLMSGFTNFESAFQTFIGNNEKWKILLDNMQLLHECRDSRDDHFESRTQQRNIALGTELSNLNEADDFDTNAPEAINRDLLNHLISIDTSRSMRMEDSQSSVSQCLQEAQLRGMFVVNDSKDSLPDQLGHVANEASFICEQEWRHEYEQRKEIWKTNVIQEQEHGVLLNQMYHDRNNIAENTVSRLEDAPLENEPTINNFQLEQNKEQLKLQGIANMQQCSADFTLNYMQNKAYEMISRHSLEKKPDQLRMYIAGPGGTGKSRIIDAIRVFFEKQNQSHRLRMASFTGVASQNIHGMTLHSALCLTKKTTLSEKRKRELIAMWRTVDYLIIDEVSMIGCKLLLEIHEALCEAKENSDLFGGINVIFVGDFAQLPPVGDTKLYSHIQKERVGTPKGQKDVFGKLLWLSVDKVVILDELVRQNTRDDSQFTELLTRLATGSCTDADYEFLNSKILKNCRTDFSDPLWQQAPTIVSNNDVKDALNTECAKSFAARTNQALHLYYATDSRKGKRIRDPDLQKKLWSYHSGKTEQRTGILPLCKGMPVMITQNYDVQNGIVNGRVGILEKISYTIDEDGYRHARSCVIRTQDQSGPPLSHLLPGEIVILQDDVPLTFVHPHSHLRSSFRRTQLPLSPAFALTGHKSQGKTLQSAIVDLQSCSSTEAAYVMLSRVKTSLNIRILRPFHKKKISTRSSEDLRKELRRLKYLHNHTISSSTSIPHPDIQTTLGGAHELQRLERWYETKMNEE